jgi:AcrR family transcriptional regulator
VWVQPAGRRSLDRDRIVEAADAVADGAGTGGLTMAAVARRLGSYSAMALYRHVPGKEALLDLMVDHVTAEVPVPGGPGPDWRADLTALARASWAMVLRHPWYAQLVHTRPPLGPNMMRRTEFVLQVLTARGATVTDAMTYAALVDRHTFGGALQAAAELDLLARHGLEDRGALAAAIGRVRAIAEARGDTPILAGWMASPTIATPTEQFELSLGFLLDGIAARLPKRRARARAPSR